jgi:putative transposase
LARIVQVFKSISTIEINRFRGVSGLTVWQRNYYEHIIRNEKELYQIRKYIEYNPLNWKDDEYNK